MCISMYISEKLQLESYILVLIYRQDRLYMLVA